MAFVKSHITGKFYSYTIRGKEMVVEEQENSKFHINYSKLINEITGNFRSFGKTITTEMFAKHVALFIESNDLIKDYEYSEFNNVEDLCNKTNNLFYQRKGYHKIQGTYGPYEFVDILLMAHDYKYAVQVHKLFHEIDVKATHKHNTFDEQLEEELDDLKFDIEILTRANEEIEDYISEYEFYQAQIEDLTEALKKSDSSINYSLINEIDMLKERQVNSNLVTAYYNALKHLNSSKWDSLKKPKFKHIIKVLNPNFNFKSINKKDRDVLLKTIFELINGNKERIECLVQNSVNDVFN